MSQATPLSIVDNPLVMPRASRSFLVGTTGTGKSTLGEILLQEYRNQYSKEKVPVRTVIIDTKPRFKAEFELSGLTTGLTGRYKKWGYGSGIIKGSYVLPRQREVGEELDQVWRLGGTIAIAHSETESEWEYTSRVATEFYERYGSKHPRVLFVDELADFFKQRSLGDIYQRIARNGRERDVALIAGSQRPRKVPVEVMTEMSRIYMFQLDFDEDLKHVYQFGIPRNVQKPNGYVFYMYDRKLKDKLPSDNYYQLKLEE